MTFDDILNAYPSNRAVFSELLSYGRTKIIPMIGAGSSAAIGYPMWSELLFRIVDDEPYCKENVSRLISSGRYEAAAEYIAESIGTNAYKKKIQRILSIANSPQPPWPTFLQDIPKIFSGPIATLNYDTVIETAFSRENFPLPSIYVPMDTYQTGAIYDALQRNQSAIIKIHGTIDNLDSIVLSKYDYDLAYGEKIVDKTLPMPQILTSAAYGRAFLFLGCSLNEDRFMDIFCDLLGGNHYAFLELPSKQEQLITKKRILDKCHIFPIWFPTGCNKTEALNLLLFELKKQLLKPEEKTYSIQYKNVLPNRENPFLFNSNTTSFEGREEQLNELMAFLDTSSVHNGMWWAVVGPGGSGKSRLAYELQQRAEPMWNVEWITNNTPFDFIYFTRLLKEDHRHLLLIIDVDYLGVTELGKWLADINTREYTKKVRIVILSRETEIASNTEETIPQLRLMLNDFNAIDGVERCLYKKDYIKLSHLSENSITKIIKSYLECMHPEANCSELDQKRIYNRLADLGITNRPLYAVFLAESAAMGKDVYTWDINAILDDVFNRELRILRKKIADAFQTSYANNPNLFSSIEVLYAESIMSGNNDIQKLRFGLPNIMKSSGLDKDTLLSRLENYGLTTNGLIPEIKPDIAGEYFVLRYYPQINTLYDNWDFFHRFFKDLSFVLTDHYIDLLDEMIADHYLFLDHFGAGLYEIISSLEIKNDTGFRVAPIFIEYAKKYAERTSPNNGFIGLSYIHPKFTYYFIRGMIAFVERIGMSEAIDIINIFRRWCKECPADSVSAEIYVVSSMIFGAKYDMYYEYFLDDLHNVYLSFSDEHKICKIIKDWVEYMLTYKSVPFSESSIRKVLIGTKKEKPCF